MSRKKAEPLLLEESEGDLDDDGRIYLGNGIRCKVVLVTPEMAKKFIERMHADQRPVAWSRVESLANDIRSGNWRTTHQGIAFDAEGRVIDGATRLNAIVQSGVAVYILVFWMTNVGFEDPIDRGRPKSVAFITGRSNKLTGALMTLRNFEHGCDSTVPLTVSEANEIFEHHRDSLEYLLSHATGAGGKLYAASIGACAWALPIDPDAVVDFARKSTSGEMIARGDAPFAFRSWMARNDNPSRWAIAMATLSCLRFHISKQSLASVYVSETSFRAVTTRRRGLKLPHTPGVEIVPTANWGASERT